MATITSEELLPLFGYKGTVVVSESSPIDPPSNIVRTTESWFVKFDWETSGLLNHIMCGNWKLEVLLEKMGPGEAALPGGTASVPFVSAPNTYSRTLSFPAGSVAAGLYRVSAIITMTGALGRPGPIAGHVDLGLVQFYDSVI